MRTQYHHKQTIFNRFAKSAAASAGHPAAFFVAVACVILWALTGPAFGFSDTWQLVINTSTTIITFLMVFVIQNTQNRDTIALHLKIDELLRALKGPNAALIDLEELSPQELEEVRGAFERIAEQCRESWRSGDSDPYKPTDSKT